MINTLPLLGAIMRFRPYDQAQTKFANLNYREILGEESDAVIINDVVEKLDLSKIEEQYPEIGNLGYHPKVMIKVMFWGYYNGHFGGRPLHRNWQKDLALRYFSNDDFPDHRTINLFRLKFGDEIPEIFTQIVMLCSELNLIGFENLSIDGQKLKACANLFQNKNLKGITKEKERIKKQLAALLKERIEFPEETTKKQDRLKRREQKLDNAVKLLKEAGGEDDNTLRYNITDPDSRIMTDKRGVKNPDYNCQNAVDDKHGVITAIKVTNVASDNGELFPLKHESEKNTGQLHRNVLGDSGYGDKEKFAEMASDEETEYYVPDKTMYSSKKNPYSKWNFSYNEEKDIYLCPQGGKMVFIQTYKDSKALEYRLYRGTGCLDCEYRSQCLKKRKNKQSQNKKTFRSICVYPDDEHVKEMRNKLQTEEGKKIYQRRMATVEPVHGDMQKNRNFSQFYLRGLRKVNIEYCFLAIAHNLRKIIIHGADALKKLDGKQEYCI